MKKFIYTIALVIAMQVAYSQSFNGVPISGDLPTAISRFKAKGFIVKKLYDNSVIMQGTLSNNQVDLFIFTTPKSKQIFKIALYFPKKISWLSLKEEYDKYKDILTQKYGEPSNEYDFFSKPYYLGDGYELQAVRMEKCTYATYWMDKDGMNISVEISKYEQVNMVYENIKNVELKQKEQGQVDKTIF